MAVATQQRDKVTSIAQLISMFDELASEVRQMSSRDKRYARLANRVDEVGSAIKKWAAQELQKMGNPVSEFYDSDGNYQIGEIPDLSRTSVRRASQTEEDKHTIDPTKIRADDTAARHRLQDEWDRQAELGRQIRDKYNPHYKR